MFKHLLVPLDGSRLAEAAIPAAQYLSKHLDAAVTLIHLIEKAAPQQIHGERHLRTREEACEYLDRVKEQYFAGNAQVACHIHEVEVRDVARSIAEHTAELAPDLIVMCTHGAGGLRQMLTGSIAQRVIGLEKMPVLLIHPDEYGAAHPVDFRRFLVALDGDPGHERGLEVAGGLAKATGAGLHLLTVIPTMGTLSGERAATGKLLPGVTQAILDLNETATREYLEERAAPWREAGVEVNVEVRRGDTAQGITQAAEHHGADLIVMGTHGKAGLQAFWAGSVTARVVGQSHLALLLVPVR